jgi:hypothetical protein
MKPGDSTPHERKQLALAILRVEVQGKLMLITDYVRSIQAK